jgi:hypothetical protein
MSSHHWICQDCGEETVTAFDNEYPPLQRGPGDICWGRYKRDFTFQALHHADYQNSFHTWIDVDELRKRQEEEQRKRQKWLASDEGKKWQKEEERKRKEEEERIEKRRIEEAAAAREVKAKAEKEAEERRRIYKKNHRIYVVCKIAFSVLYWLGVLALIRAVSAMVFISTQR